MAGGKDGPDQVHGGGGEGTTSNSEKQGKCDAEDILSTIAEGREIGVGRKP